MIECPVVDVLRRFSTVVINRRDPGQVTTLEFNSFLERQLWPSFDTKASPAHLITIALLINEKAGAMVMDAQLRLALRWFLKKGSTEGFCMNRLVP